MGLVCIAGRDSRACVVSRAARSIWSFRQLRPCKAKGTTDGLNALRCCYCFGASFQRARYGLNKLGKRFPRELRKIRNPRAGHSSALGILGFQTVSLFRVSKYAQLQNGRRLKF